MPSAMWNRAKWALSLLTAMAGAGASPSLCLGQQSATPAAASWTPLTQALNETLNQGMPTVVVVTSRSTPSSQAFRVAFAQSPEAAAFARVAQFAELPAEIYANQV